MTLFFPDHHSQDSSLCHLCDFIQNGRLFLQKFEVFRVLNPNDTDLLNLSGVGQQKVILNLVSFDAMVSHAHVKILDRLYTQYYW